MTKEQEQYEEVFTPDIIYWELIDLLQDVKLTQGPLAVSATLNRHPSLKNLLLEKQKLKIQTLEIGLENFNV